MFESLIRRKSAGASRPRATPRSKSTTVSLSTAVPRPAERREEERISAMLRDGKLVDQSGAQQLIRIKNMSAGGIMAIVGHIPAVGEAVEIELSSQKIPATVVWTRDDMSASSSTRMSTLASFSPAASRGSASGAAAAARNPVQGVGQARQNLLHGRRARHFARRNEGRADRGILRRQEGRRGRREPAADQGRGPLVLRAPGRNRVRQAAGIRRAFRMGRQKARARQPQGVLQEAADARLLSPAPS